MQKIAKTKNSMIKKTYRGHLGRAGGRDGVGTVAPIVNLFFRVMHWLLLYTVPYMLNIDGYLKAISRIL
jgi:hypothetical protein